MAGSVFTNTSHDICISTPAQPRARPGSGWWLWRMLDDWYERYSGRRSLSRLDDRALRDIGITRKQAQDEVIKPFWEA